MITTADLTMVWRLFRYDAQRQKKRIALTVLGFAVTFGISRAAT